MRTQTKGQTTTYQFTLTAHMRAGVRWDDVSKVWVGYAPALKVYSQAKTKARARKAIASAVSLFLKVAYTKGVLERVLADAGFLPSIPVAEGKRPPRNMARVSILEEKILKQEKFTERRPYSGTTATTQQEAETGPSERERSLTGRTPRLVLFPLRPRGGGTVPASGDGLDPLGVQLPPPPLCLW